jgi:hypothetical protein
MHDCANCGQACYCDGDDLPCPAPEACTHECQEERRQEERWLPVEGFPGYEVSSLGRVRSSKGVIKIRTGRNGYPSVPLWRNRKPTSRPLHRLVARAFLGEAPEASEVDHVDGDIENAAEANLQYVSHAENMRRARAMGLAPARPAQICSLTSIQVAEIRAALAVLNGERSRGFIAHYARKFGVSHGAISHVVHGRSWKTGKAYGRVHDGDNEAQARAVEA